MTFDEAMAMPGVLLGKVNGGSMYPILHTGDLVLVRPCMGDLPRVGDIITFDSCGVSITHRLLALQPKVVTKGDNLPRLDTMDVQVSDIVGVAFAAFRPSTGRFWELDRSYTHPKFRWYAHIELGLGRCLVWLPTPKAQAWSKYLLLPLYYGLIYRKINRLQQTPVHGIAS